MQREVSGAVRPLYGSLGVKGLKCSHIYRHLQGDRFRLFEGDFFQKFSFAISKRFMLIYSFLVLSLIPFLKVHKTSI